MRRKLDGRRFEGISQQLWVFPTIDRKCPDVMRKPCGKCQVKHFEGMKCEEVVRCKWCDEKHHSEFCTVIYEGPSVLSDTRSCQEGNTGRCPCCLQVKCSVPCRWSEQGIALLNLNLPIGLHPDLFDAARLRQCRGQGVGSLTRLTQGKTKRWTQGGTSQLCGHC